jgi:hypothetical protein
MHMSGMGMAFVAGLPVSSGACAVGVDHSAQEVIVSIGLAPVRDAASLGVVT